MWIRFLKKGLQAFNLIMMKFFCGFEFNNKYDSIFTEGYDKIDRRVINDKLKIHEFIKQNSKV